MASISQSYDGRLKEMLQSSVQSVQWTYIIFWHLCPQELVLVWGDGYYNGSIKTRKTMQPTEVSTEEAALSRSEQLRELYNSLAVGDQLVVENQRRPSVALSPEDLTETEWFYLMCVSFSFPIGVGLVGEAYTKQHVWLTGAHEVDSKVFTRAILAKNACIKTVICIPLLNGVVELGTTEKVEETIQFVQHVKLFFVLDNNNLILPSPKPTHSAHSSNTTLSPHQIPTTSKPLGNIYSMDEDNIENLEEVEEDDKEEDEYEKELDFVKETCHLSSFPEPHQDKDAMVSVIEANELLQLDMSKDIRFRSHDDCFSNLDDYRFDLLATSHDDSCRDESTNRLSDNLEIQNMSIVHLQTSETLQSEELANKDTHYSNTVSTILNNTHLTQWPNSRYTTQSSFAKWTRDDPNYHYLPTKTTSNSQKVLKYMIFTVPFLHSNDKSVGLRKAVSHEELSVNHVLAERRRREKLNEKFIILRSLVPLVTKMDKASILGDTIKYVKQLRKKIQDLEASGCQDGLDSLKRKIRVVDGGDYRGKAATTVQVEVSIIESDALVEIQCVHREGLLLDVMKKLRELGVEITTIQSCVDGLMCTLEMRAKVKMNDSRKKIGIIQVKGHQANATRINKLQTKFIIYVCN